MKFEVFMVLKIGAVIFTIVTVCVVWYVSTNTSWFKSPEDACSMLLQNAGNTTTGLHGIINQKNNMLI
jgi:hypothetical protein